MIRRLAVFSLVMFSAASCGWAQTESASAAAPSTVSAAVPAAMPAAVPSANFPTATANTPVQNNGVQAALHQREEELLDQLASLKIDAPNYQEQLQSIGAQLRDVQAQMQEIPVLPNSVNPAVSNTALTNQAANPAVNPAFPANTANLSPAAPNTAPLVPQTGNFSGSTPNLGNQTPLANQGVNMPAGQTPLPSGNWNSQGNYSVQGSFDPMSDPMLLKQIKEELTFQLKQIDQTTAMLGPQDQALAATLTEQKEELLKQLKDINEKLGEPADSLAETVNLMPDPALSDSAASNADEYAAKVAKIQQAATLLQEAGLMDLANRALNQAAALGTGGFSENDAAAAGWFTDNGVKQGDIDDLRASAASLKEQLTTITASLEEVQTQLKLLSRQMVSAPAAEPAEEKPAETTAEPAQ